MVGTRPVINQGESGLNGSLKPLIPRKTFNQSQDRLFICLLLASQPTRPPISAKHIGISLNECGYITQDATMPHSGPSECHSAALIALIMGITSESGAWVGSKP